LSRWFAPACRFSSRSEGSEGYAENRQRARQGAGVAAAPCAGAELELDVRADEAEEREALDEDDDSDDELGVDGVADDESLSSVALDSAGELSAVDVAGAVVAGEDGVVGLVSDEDDDEVFVSWPSVVVPDDDELLTSADTGFCPISSTPVTIAMATTNTETA